MNKTKIEWCDYTINPVKGLCPMACSYCYARRMYKRFKWNPEIRYDPNVMLDTGNISKPSRIFVGSTMELFGDWIRPEWLKSTFDWIKTDIGIHTYIFLTKQPQNLAKWSPFPENCWVGVSVTNQQNHNEAICALSMVKASVKFISYEPLLQHIVAGQAYDLSEVQWVIIGQQTPPTIKTTPKIEWIQEILVAAHNANDIPVFMKNNLKPLLSGTWSSWEIRQELPQAKSNY